MGLFPNNFLNYSKASIDYLVNNKNAYNLTVLETTTTPTPQQQAQGDN
jgi:NADH-quinone oxidoreductase subunit M